jgi:hypothetical protein
MHTLSPRPKSRRPQASASAARRPLPRTPLPIRHVTLPFAETGRADALPGETIGAFVERQRWAKRIKIGRTLRYSFPLPTVCVVNGQPLLQREWKRRRIKAGDVVEFWSRPWGKSGTGDNTGKMVLAIVAMIALTAIAGPAGTALGGAIGVGAIGASIITGAILVGGALLISALTKPSTGGQNGNSTNDQVQQLNSIAASGNTARLLQPITVQYGRIKSFPDFAITPWSEFSGNDQYLNVLLSIGLGKYSAENLYIDDTILWQTGAGVSATFTGVDVQFYDPGTPVTLFPTNVVQSSDVSGQDISTTPVGGFVANPASTQAQAIAVDLVFPNGLFTLDATTGAMSTAAATIIVEYRQVDNAGGPIGGWITAVTQTFTGSSRTPQRQTIKFDVTPARYEVRVSRSAPPSRSNVISRTPGAITSTQVTVDPSSNIVNDCVWVGLRAFIDGPSSFPVSTVAIRIKASQQLTQQSARKFGYLGTRVLNVWNAGTGTFVEQPTRNPFWAAYDAAIDSIYGCAVPPSKVDFQAIFDMAAAAGARGDTFDMRFTAAVAAPEALDTILRVARSRHRWSGDVLTFVRDEWSDVPRMLLTDREIVRGSLNLEYVLNPDDGADAVIVEYVDEQTWAQADIQYPHNSISFTAVNPTRIRLPGIVNRDHAHREAAFYYLQSQYRRVNVSLDTEHDGRMLGFGSRVRVQTELPMSWGYSGAVVAQSGNTLTVSPAPTWDVGSHYIAIRTKTGRQFGPVLCTQGTGPDQVVLDATDLAAVQTGQGMTLAQALGRANGADDPSFDFGVSAARARDCIVMSGRPSKDRVTLGLVIDNQAVHATSLPDTPVLPSLPSLVDARTPIIAGLGATFRQGVAEPILDASWVPAAGAQYYVARVSYDGGATSTQIYEGVQPHFSQVVERAGLRLLVAGVGVRHGPYTAVDVSPPTIQIAENTVILQSLIAGLSDRVTNVLKQVDDNNRAIQSFIASFAAEQEAHNFIDKVRSKQVLNAQITNIKDNFVSNDALATAETEIIQAAQANADSSIAAYDVRTQADFTTGVRGPWTAGVQYTAGDAVTFSGPVYIAIRNNINAQPNVSALDWRLSPAASAKVESLQSAQAYADHAIATYDTTVSTSVGGLSATVSQNFTAVGTINGKLAGAYVLSLDVDGLLGDFRFLNDGTTVNAAWRVNHFTIGGPGLNSKPAFDIGVVDGIATIVVRGDLLADGTIVARNIAAGAINASILIADNVIVTGHLSADAATRLDVAQNGNVTVPLNTISTTLVSLGVNSTGGGFWIEGSIDIDSDFGFLNSSPNTVSPADFFDANMFLSVDGVQTRTILVPASLYRVGWDSSRNANSAGFRCKGHFAVSHKVTLSPGPHTISLVMGSSTNRAGLSYSITTSTIVSLEARRQS